MVIVRHLIAAAIVSYGLSLAFWAAGTFVLVPFIVVSAGCAVAGAAAGLLAGRRLWLTIAATAVIRLGVFGLVTYGPGAA